MTKRTLYALLLLLGCPFRGAAQVPCVPCLSITIPASQSPTLPGELDGLTVLVRVPYDRADSLDLGAFAQIRERGGRPGVLVDVPVTPSVPDDLGFRLRVALTQLRGRLPGEAVLALHAAPPIQPLMTDLASYADAIVGATQGARTAGVRFWPLVETADLRVALAATAGGSAEQWVAALPPGTDARLFVEALVKERRASREGYREDVEVSGARRLTVAEIVARHQATARRQAADIARTISHGELSITFEAPGFPAPVTISSDTIVYTDRERTEIEQRRIRVNGIEFRGGGVPRLPILEPERAAAPPLTITLTDLYRYRLDGEATVDGVACYVVAFEPVDATRTLFRGRAWIAQDSFAMVKVAATQTALRGAIVSAEQVDQFRQVRRGVWMLARSDVRQLYEGAAHRTPIHRRLDLRQHEIDPPDFEARRQTAYASDALMLRDTAEGYRYLKREPAAVAGAQPTVTVAKASTRIRTLAAGVIIDPNISRPLPFAGLSYVDFDLFGTGAQFNGFFGGAYGQLAFSVPSVAGSRWQLAGRAFGIASSYNDRSFRAGREVYEENVRQRPAHAAAWLLRPLTPRLSVRAGYELDYTRLRASPETAATFAVPADQVVHGLRVALEGQRAGWSGSVWWNGARRAGWRPWGRTGDHSPAHDDFQRFGVSVARSTPLSSSVMTRVEAQWMDGRDLDRFSRYSFGTFDNRLRGYPSALVRYDRGAVLRTAVAWSVGPLMRLDGFLDTAAVSDPGYGGGLRNYTGLGLAAEAPVPFGMLAAVEWGYGFRGVNANGKPGTHVIRVSAFKVF